MSDPSAAEQPKNHPTAEQPAVGRPTEPPATAQLPTDPPGHPAAQQPAPEQVPTAAAADAPTGPPPPPAAGPAYATAPPPRGRFRQVAAHRATQLVAVGVLGLIVGGGLVALLDHDGYRGGHGRPGLSRMDDRGPGPRPGPGHRPGPPGSGWNDHGHFER
jgi:hypothetical protein